MFIRREDLDVGGACIQVLQFNHIDELVCFTNQPVKKNLTSYVQQIKA